MERRLCAILAADVVGYSKLMGEDEEATLTHLKAHRSELFEPCVVEHSGRIIKLMGDGTLVEFSSVVEAVKCAVAIQSAQAIADGPIRLRIGINLGDIIVEGDDIYGDGVNIAARIEPLADPGGIVLSAFAYQQVERKVDFAFEDAGEHRLKNIDSPIQVYRVALDTGENRRTEELEAPVQTNRPSIAVLAFDNMSDDPEQEYFSDGISEDIITELSRFQDLFVIARNSSFSYKGTSTKVQEIGVNLGVEYVVEGSVRKAGNRIRVTVQLVEAATGNHIWAERYDRELEDIFDLQDEITQAIVTMLPFRLRTMLAENVRTKRSDNLTAVDCFMRARWLGHKTAEGVRDEVLDLLSRAIAIDPDYAPAYALMADLHAYSVYTFSPLGDDPTIAARQYIEQALKLGGDDHYVHAKAAHVYLSCGLHDHAQTHAERAVALNPNEIEGLLVRGFVTSYTGDPGQGVILLKQALDHNPLAPDSDYEMLAETYYLLGEYDGAIKLYQRWRDPPIHMYTHLAACHAQLGQLEAMRHAATIFNKKRPEGSDFSFYASAHARLCKQPVQADHWLDGYRKAGLID